MSNKTKKELETTLAELQDNLAETSDILQACQEREQKAGTVCYERRTRITKLLAEIKAEQEAYTRLAIELSKFAFKIAESEKEIRRLKEGGKDNE